MTKHDICQGERVSSFLTAQLGHTAPLLL